MEVSGTYGHMKKGDCMNWHCIAWITGLIWVGEGRFQTLWMLGQWLASTFSELMSDDISELSRYSL
jgi:hypothetical protein